METILHQCYSQGLLLRIGVTHGDLEELEDIDGTRNYVGTSINFAARIAFSDRNTGCLAEQSFRAFYYEAFGERTGRLHFFQTKTIRIVGKSHDKTFICYEANYALLPFHRRFSKQKLRNTKTEAPEIAGLIIAYDLPRFSAGDRLQLSQRFRSLVDTFRSLKNNEHIPKGSRIYFLPGGDGGILVLTGVKTISLEIVSKFSELLKVESQNKLTDISVKSRIGVNYGRIQLLRNGAGVIRPTGRACFIADEIANDSIAKSKGRTIFSETLVDVLASGSDEHFKEKFEFLPPLKRGVAKGIKRFCEATPPPEHPLFGRLTGSRGSWEQS